MPISVSWDNDEHTCLLLEFSGHWTWDEFQSAIRQGVAMRAEIAHTVHLLADMRLGTTPPNYAFLHVKAAFDTAPANTGITVIVSSNAFLITTYTIFCRVYKQLAKRLALTDSLEQERAIIRRLTRNDT